MYIVQDLLDFFDISGVERVQMVKNRDIKGALASDHALREVVEKRVLFLIKNIANVFLLNLSIIARLMTTRLCFVI